MDGRVRIVAITLPLLLALSSAAGARMNPVMLGGGVATSETTPFFSDNFNRSDTSTPATGVWDSETDAGGKLSISSSALTYLADSTSSGNLVEGTFSDTEEVTVKFKIKFSSLAAHTSASDQGILTIYNDVPAATGLIKVRTDSSGNIVSYLCSIYDNSNAQRTSPPITMTGIQADTYYDVVYYQRASSSTGGASCKIGAWDEAATTFAYTNDQKQAGFLRFGVTSATWTSGSTISFDDFAIYEGDHR